MNPKQYSITSENFSTNNIENTVRLYHYGQNIANITGDNFIQIMIEVLAQTIKNQKQLDLNPNDFEFDINSNMGTPRQNEDGYFITMDKEKSKTFDYANQYNSMLIKNAMAEAQMRVSVEENKICLNKFKNQMVS
jgi:hypothetical protein